MVITTMLTDFHIITSRLYKLNSKSKKFKFFTPESRSAKFTQTTVKLLFACYTSRSDQATKRVSRMLDIVQ